MREFRPVFVSLLFIALVFISSNLAAQTQFLEGFDSVPDTSSAKLNKRINQELDYQQKMKELEIRRAEYLIASIDHREKVFSWQHTASVVIFILVLVIVTSGLILSYLHFYKDLKSVAPAGAEIELNLKGLKVNSSIIGLLILVLSIAFLYLYLIYVFPINELNIDTKVF